MSDKEQTTESPLAASVERLRTELDHWFGKAVSTGGKALDAFGLRNMDKTWSPTVDLIETNDEIVVDFCLPGVDPKAVEVSIAGNMLTVKGEMSPFQTEDNETVHLRQCHRGPFQRSIPMPVPVDAESVSAESNNGLLTVRLTKAERTKSRQIPVNVPSKETVGI